MLPKINPFFYSDLVNDSATYYLSKYDESYQIDQYKSLMQSTDDLPIPGRVSEKIVAKVIPTNTRPTGRLFREE